MPSASVTCRSRSLEKGKQPGSHLLSGAVVNPRALRELFRDRLTMEDIPTYGEVPGEAVYLLTRRGVVRIPPPPTMRNHGNCIVSVSQLGRFLARAGRGRRRGGAARRRDAQKLLVADGRVLGIRTGDKGRGRDGKPLGDLRGRVATSSRRSTVLAEGTQGYLTGAAIDQFGLRGREAADLGARA